jgi:hypothetical protein
MSSVATLTGKAPATKQELIAADIKLLVEQLSLAWPSDQWSTVSPAFVAAALTASESARAGTFSDANEEARG